MIRERGGKEARGAVALPFLLAILCHREKLIFLSRKKKKKKYLVFSPLFFFVSLLRLSFVFKKR